MYDERIGEFLERLADRVPAPGGGAAAALQVGLGAALVGMVGRYSLGEKYAAHRDVVERVVGESDRLRVAALRLAEEDAVAFGAVAAAYGLPRDGAEAKAARSAAIAEALVGAGRPPVAVVGVAREVVGLAEELLPIGNRNVITDVAAAVEAARGAAACGRVNVEINLGGIKDEAARAELVAGCADVDEILARCDRVTAAVRELIAW
ncbi:cyclodeaminase/cyclohydrolase family protein [Actinokineospora auranticolor]|uniref:Formiminotetrahydrofolate cyclodeaminase n=1 Tax=Actinokineospora auranticolor TaxID=155976 RepID=A0A2S6H142_9PSEU|nr:cyclodeaminase/cyclohydrolase family protein [Actinokineospora auranticolor]PPK71183.1 formiminotetrahydrofolate cyclodeaminase [Actinokineospora auranticolor]